LTAFPAPCWIGHTDATSCQCSYTVPGGTPFLMANNFKSRWCAVPRAAGLGERDILLR
jgi:hypothetical protein